MFLFPIHVIFKFLPPWTFTILDFGRNHANSICRFIGIIPQLELFLGMVFMDNTKLSKLSAPFKKRGEVNAMLFNVHIIRLSYSSHKFINHLGYTKSFDMIRSSQHAIATSMFFFWYFMRKGSRNFHENIFIENFGIKETLGILIGSFSVDEGFILYHRFLCSWSKIGSDAFHKRSSMSTILLPIQCSLHERSREHVHS